MCTCTQKTQLYAHGEKGKARARGREGCAHVCRGTHQRWDRSGRIKRKPMAPARVATI